MNDYDREVQRDRTKVQAVHARLMQHITASGGLDNLEIRDTDEAIALCTLLYRQTNNIGIEAIGNYLREMRETDTSDFEKRADEIVKAARRIAYSDRCCNGCQDFMTCSKVDQSVAEGGSGMSETGKLIQDMLGKAKVQYEGHQVLEEFLETMRNPVIDSKDMALSVCNALIKISIERGAMAEDSVMHRLSLALMDYIARE
ncbi:hypothetical protein AGMMS49944_12460 [Spirochaetia bacterium]|nr:hypothetical protein AGMMS49944_12460 [Spirochaetia bacterium]